MMLTGIGLLESFGGIEGIIPNDRHISLVPEFICNVVLEQERSVGRKNSIFASG